MKREIKFRGKRLDNGEWVYGYFNKNEENGKCYITTQSKTGGAHPHEVDPETVGEFTGECTNFGQKERPKIYEGDIVEVNTLGINYNSSIVRGVVVFTDGCWTVRFFEHVYDVNLETYRQSLYVKCFVVNRAIKVVGNIHENPEPLEAAQC